MLGRDRVEETLDSELRAYVDELADRDIPKSMPREEASRPAMAEARRIEHVKEAVRETRLGVGMQTVLRDILSSDRTGHRVIDPRYFRLGLRLSF